MIKPFAHEQARYLARKLLVEAEENEPPITADLQKIALEISAEIFDLENKFKTDESLTRKIFNAVKINSLPLEEISETVNDALRYTFIFSPENYAKGFHKAIEMLWEAGYFVPERRMWNAWKNIGTEFDKGYRGINITAISSQKQIFELQFHTAESYRLKNETHHFYEEIRDKNISVEREKELVKMMKKKAAAVKRPEGI